MIEVIFIGISVALASLVAQLVMNILEQRRCPDDTLIEDFMLRRLDKDDPEYSRVIGHLGICEQCQQKLREFSTKPNIEDHLVE